MVEVRHPTEFIQFAVSVWVCSRDVEDCGLRCGFKFSSRCLWELYYGVADYYLLFTAATVLSCCFSQVDLKVILANEFDALKNATRKFNSVSSCGWNHRSWSRYMWMHSSSWQSRFRFGFVRLNFVACVVVVSSFTLDACGSFDPVADYCLVLTPRTRFQSVFWGRPHVNSLTKLVHLNMPLGALIPSHSWPKP